MYIMKCINSYSNSIKNDLSPRVTLWSLCCQGHRMLTISPQLLENTKTSAITCWIITRINYLCQGKTGVGFRNLGLIPGSVMYQPRGFELSPFTSPNTGFFIYKMGIFTPAQLTQWETAMSPGKPYKNGRHAHHKSVYPPLYKAVGAGRSQELFKAKTDTSIPPMSF